MLIFVFSKKIVEIKKAIDPLIPYIYDETIYFDSLHCDVFFIENVMHFICVILFCGFCVQPAWGVSIKVGARVLPRCQFNGVASSAEWVIHSPAQHCIPKNQATRIYFRAENKGVHLGRRMVVEF